VKTYSQYCSVARALDAVGDRWVLLIVRELLAFGPSRYSDLQRGLPGIASNLLAERLRTMEADGLVERRDAPAPIGTRVYELTARGRDLEGVLAALSRWGLPRMVEGPSADDAVQPQWSALFAGLNLSAGVRARSRLTLMIETGSEAVRVVLTRDGFEVRRGDGDADVALRGSAGLVGGVLSGLVPLSTARRQGLVADGRVELLTRLLDAHRTSTGAAS
jgi:DNA-binding HxlR family transcriptional regulator